MIAGRFFRFIDRRPCAPVSGAILMTVVAVICNCPSLASPADGGECQAKAPTAALADPAVGQSQLNVEPPGPQLIAERSTGATLTWRRDLQESLDAAGRANKLVLIDVYTDWCGWCKRLDRDTYTNQNIIKLLNEQFICVKLNAEDGAVGQSVAKKYDVHGFPCTIVLDSSGKRRGLFYGYRNPEGYSQEVAKILGSN